MSTTKLIILGVIILLAVAVPVVYAEMEIDPDVTKTVLTILVTLISSWAGVKVFKRLKK